MKSIKPQHIRFHLFTVLCFVFAGALLSSPYFMHRWQQKNAAPVFAATSQHSVATKQATVSGTPTRIDVPSVNVSVDVAPGYYNKESQTWTLSTNKAHYATITPKPNDANGNTFIYGHNRPEVFSKLLNLHKGDEAIVTTGNKHTFIYKMVNRHDTKPTDDSLFRYQGPPILTLQTCSGFWYQNRSLFVFELVRAV
jgi:LPXTG-site transpeptidase (sortase) family protein